MTVLLRRFYATLLLLVCATSLFAQSSALRLATTATVQPRWTALANHKIYLLTTTATQASGKNVMGILAATNKGLYQSLDTGQTWGNLGLPNDDVYDAVVIGGSIIAATDKGIQTRASVGAAWQTRTYPVSNQGSGSGSTQATVQQRGLPTYSLQTAGGRLFAATTRGVYRSNDGGVTWTQTEPSTAGTLSGKTVRTLALLGNTLFAAVWNDGIYRSTDNGTTWIFTDIVPGSSVEKTFRTLSVYGATGYAGSSEGNLYQTQNGTSWTKVVSAGNNGQSGVNARGVEALARYGSTIVGAVYNGIAVSHNNGQTWSLMPIATQDVNTIIMLPPKPIARRSSTFSAVAASKGSATLQLVTCDGNDGLTCGGGGIGVGSGGTSGGSSGGGVSGYGLPACNPLGANLNLTPSRAPEQPSTLAVTFSVSSQVTLTDFRIEMAAPSAPSSWIDITTSFNQNTNGFVNGSALIPAGFMQTPGTYSIRAFGIREDGACTGGYVSEAQSFIVDPAVPVLNSLSLAPTGSYTGQTTTLTLSGSNFFLNNAFVTFYNASGQPVSFPFVQTGNSGALITVNFTAPASGLYYAEVRNRIGEVTYPSARLPFTIAVPPAPVLSSVTLPSSALRVVAGATGAITLNGSSFSTTALDGSAGGAIVSVNGQNGLWSVTSRTASSLTVQLPASVAAGSYTLHVINADGQQSASTVQVVVVPPLAVSSSSPATIFVEEQTTISLVGTFRAGATVVNAPNLAGAPALSVSDNGISFGVNIPGVNAPSSYTITLSEPTTYGQSAITHIIPVLFPLPALTSLTPNELDASPASGGVASTITIAGTGFTSRTSVFAGTRDLSAFITSRSSTSLTLNFPVGTFPAPEIAQLRAENPGNQVSGTLPLTIKNVAPVLTTLMPQPLVATQSGQITITGSKFFNATVTQVFAGGVALAGATVAPSSITVTVPASLLPDIGTVDFEVRNTFGANVQTSAVQTVRIIHPTPEITSLAPLTIPAFDNAQTLTITGAKFSLTRSRVVWVKNGVETVLTLLPNPTATQLQATIPASLLTELGAVTVRVQNQDAADANGGPSATSSLTIVPPVPIVTSVTPNTATAGAGAVSVVITGSKFTQAGLRLVIRNAQTGLVRDLNSPTFGNSSTVSGIIPADVVLLAGNYTLTVINAANGSGQGGGESTSSVPFTILNPAPTITNLAPNPATVFAPFTLDVQGTGFVSGATSVTVDGQTFAPASVTVVSSVLLRVSVAAITSAKNATVSVTNPQLNNQGGGTATTTFPVIPPVPTAIQAQGNQASGTLTRNIAGVLTVTGTGFVAGAVIEFNGQDLTTTVVDQRTVRANVSAALLLTHGVYSVTVRNPQFSALGGGTATPAIGVTVQNPTPTLSSITPTSVTRGNDASITLTGNNFYDGAVAYLSGASSSTFATVFVNSGSLSLSIPASSLPVAGTYSIAVKNSDPTPGFSGTRTLTVNNPAPVLVLLSVNETEAYSNDLTVTVTGSGFENGIQAYWTPSGGSRQALAAPTGVSAGSCTLTIPAALLTQAGAFTITLENAAPSLGASNPLTFTVLDRVPTLTSVAPNPIEALSGNTQITLTGDYFAPSANAYWNGVLLTRVGAASRTLLTATVPASRLTIATVAAITVQNPQFSGRGGGTSTPARDLVITNPLPTLTDITPDFIAAGSTRTVITLTGTAFMPVSFVEVGNGSTWTAVTTTYVSPTKMTIVLSSAALVQPSVLMVRAVSPTISTLGGAPQGGGTSAELPLVIRPGDPTLTRLSPTSATLSSTIPTVTITLIGTGFVPTSVVRVAGVPTTGTTYISPTQLRLTLARPAGTYNLSVHTPPVVLNGIPQGGGTSGTIAFAFLNPQPSLTALTPATTAASLAEWTLRLTGADFTPTSRVRYNGTLVGIANVQFVSPTELRVAVPAPLITVASITVSVENPIIAGQGGGNSATLPLAIEFPRPLLTSLSDYTTSASLVAWTMTINGKLFAPGASVTLNGTPITATVVSSTKILAVLPAAQMRHTGFYTLSVSNPTPGGGEVSATFTVNNPNPTLTSIAPTGLPSGIPAGVTQAFTLIGTNFVTTSTIILDGAAIPITTLTGVNWIATTTLTVSVPAWLISTSGSYTLRVVNPAPGGGQSGTKSFTVTTGSVAYAEFTGVTTAVLAGSADAFSIRFKDTFGNAVDYPATTVQFTNETGTSTGTISLNRTGVGAFNAPSRAYIIDGNYRLWISGIASTTGNASFVVDATNDARVEFSGVVGRVQAGGMLPSFTVRYFDKFNNPTDRNVGDVTLRYSPGGLVRHTLGVTRLSEGVYQTLPYSLTIADTYYVQVNGIGQAKTSYVSSTATVITGTLPSFDVTPTTAVRATLSGVDIDLNAGNTQSNAKVRSYDQYGNLTNVPTLTTLTFSNATDATAGVQSSTGTVALTRTGFGLYDVDGTQIKYSGAYTLTSPEMAQTTGGRFFQVRSAAVSYVEFVGVPTIATIGNLEPVTIRFRDRYNNLLDRESLLTFTKMSGSPSSTGTIELARTTLGVSTATLLSLTDEGMYSLKVSGMTTIPIRGNTDVILIREGEITSVCFSVTPERIPAGTVPVIQAWYNLGDGERAFTHPREVIYTHSPSGMTGTIPMYRIGVGTSQSRPELQPFTLAGTYTLSVANPPNLPSCQTTFVVEGGTAASITTTTLPQQCITAGQSLTPLSFEVRDRWGNLTNAFNNNALQQTPINGTFTATPNVSTGTILLTTLATGTLTEIAPPRIFTTAGTYSLYVPIYVGENRVASTTVTFCVQPSNLPAVRFIVVTQPTSIVAGTTSTGIVLEARDIYDNPTNTIPININFALIGNSVIGLIFQLTQRTGQILLISRNTELEGGISVVGNYDIQAIIAATTGTNRVSFGLITVENAIGVVKSITSIYPNVNSQQFSAGVPFNILFQARDARGNPTNDLENGQVKFVLQAGGAPFQIASVENTGTVGEFRLQSPIQLNMPGRWRLRFATQIREFDFSNILEVTVITGGATRATMTLLPTITRNSYQNALSLRFFDLVDNVTPYVFSTTSTPNLDVAYEGRSSSGVVVSTGTKQFTLSGNVYLGQQQQFIVAGNYTFSLRNPVTNELLPIANNTFTVEDRTTPQLRYISDLPRVILGDVLVGNIKETTCTISYQDLPSARQIIIILKTVPTNTALQNFDITLADNENAQIVSQTFEVNRTKQWQITVPNSTGELRLVLRGQPSVVGMLLANIRYLVPSEPIDLTRPETILEPARNGTYTSLYELTTQRISVLGRDCQPPSVTAFTSPTTISTLKNTASVQNSDDARGNSLKESFNTIVYLLGSVEKQNGRAMSISTAHPLSAILKASGLSQQSIRPAYPDFAEQDTTVIMAKTNKRVKLPNYSNIFIIEAPSEPIQERILAALQRQPWILYAHKMGKITFQDTQTNDPYIKYNPSSPSNLGFITGIPWSWYLDNIQARKAWDIYKGETDKRIKIGVIDQSIFDARAVVSSPDSYVLHPDLRSRLISSSPRYPYPWFHAQAVAGIIGAEADNCIGSAGINWFADMRHFAPEDFSLSSPALALFAPVEIMNFSLATGSVYGEDIRAKFATAYKMNKLMVAAAGNDQGTNPSIVYPAGFGQGVITVGGTGPGDTRAYSFGKHLDISAPAFGILGTVLGTRKYGEENIPFVSENLTNYQLPAILDNDYAILSGTSFATPMVTATLSLMKGLALQKGLTLDNDDLENVLYLSADRVGYVYGQRELQDINDMEKSTLSAAWNVPIGSRTEESWRLEMGYGRLNVYTALQLINGGSFSQGSINSSISAYPAPAQTLSGVMINGTEGITDGKYDIEQYEITGTVTFPPGFDNAFIWGRGAGHETEGMTPPDYIPDGMLAGGFALYGIGGSELVSGTRTASQATMHTYIYKATKRYNNNGTTTAVNIAFPTTPSGVRFYYTLFKKPTTVLAFTKNSSVTNSADNVQITSFEETKLPLTSLTLFAPAPNPTSSETTLRFALPNDASVSVSILDVLGTTVAAPMVRASLAQGEHSIRLNLAALASGSYRVRLDALSSSSAETRFVQLHILK